MDRLASITAFVRVVESGGFTAAARRLDLSTTTVSDQVQAIGECARRASVEPHHPAGDPD
jgi:molybdenum-dependent DNA-binding transcriptional regulator ModE